MKWKGNRQSSNVVDIRADQKKERHERKKAETLEMLGRKNKEMTFDPDRSRRETEFHNRMSRESNPGSSIRMARHPVDKNPQKFSKTNTQVTPGKWETK